MTTNQNKSSDSYDFDNWQNEMQFFSLAQSFSESQIELDADFQKALNRVGHKMSRKEPTKKRF